MIGAYLTQRTIVAMLVGLFLRLININLVGRRWLVCVLDRTLLLYGLFLDTLLLRSHQTRILERWLGECHVHFRILQRILNLLIGLWLELMTCFWCFKKVKIWTNFEISAISTRKLKGILWWYERLFLDLVRGRSRFVYLILFVLRSRISGDGFSCIGIKLEILSWRSFNIFELL